jgi:hypothetical protein
MTISFLGLRESTMFADRKDALGANSTPHHYGDGFDTLNPIPCALPFLASESCEQILRMDRFGEDFEFVALHARPVEQIGGCCLSGEKKDLA